MPETLQPNPDLDMNLNEFNPLEANEGGSVLVENPYPRYKPTRFVMEQAVELPREGWQPYEAPELPEAEPRNLDNPVRSLGSFGPLREQNNTRLKNRQPMIDVDGNEIPVGSDYYIDQFEMWAKGMR